MLIAVGVVFKTPILRSFSNFLMKQDDPEKADLMVVLSGNAFDRGNEGARLYKEGYAKHIICPGGNLERAFLIMGDTVYESELLRKNILRNGVPDSMVTVLRYGTSTIEEADTLIGYCREHKITKVLVVTNLFHTRRAGKVYKKRFAKEGIQVIMRGAHDSQFDENLWWQSEYGLIGLNNEYMKTLYYLIKKRPL
ncbi:MAG: hypothetical protein JWO03_997 [Bacteroidetes bacterium]|nr:hypothetical protein [Bacteroidota bacterium]